MNVKRGFYHLMCIGLLFISKLGFTSAKASNEAIVLEVNDNPDIHYHGSHHSHASHHSHYSCMLSKADSIAPVSDKQIQIIKKNLCYNHKTFIKAFLSSSTADNGYDDKNGFKGEAIFIITKELIPENHYHEGWYRINCIAIPCNENINSYYYYYEDFQTEKEGETFITSIGNDFKARRNRSGARADKDNWMYKL